MKKPFDWEQHKASNEALERFIEKDQAEKATAKVQEVEDRREDLRSLLDEQAKKITRTQKLNVAMFIIAIIAIVIAGTSLYLQVRGLT